MSQTQQLGEDLAFVKQAVVQREKVGRIPAPIAWTVAIYVVIGYTLLDFEPRWAGLFFLVGGLAMGVLGWVFGRREAIRSGEHDRVEGRKAMLHWFSIVLAIAGVIGLAVSRDLRG